MLAGDPPDGGKTAGPVTDTDPAVARPRDRRASATRIVIVKAGANPAAQAAAAAAVGARAVLLADPADDRPLPAISAGRAAVPVIGITGDAAAEGARGQARHRGRASGRPSGRSSPTC